MDRLKNYLFAKKRVYIILILLGATALGCKQDDSPSLIENPVDPVEFEGTLQWSRTLGGSGNDEVFSISTTTDNAFIIAGNTTSSDGDITDKNDDSNDVWVSKMSPLGEIIWSRTYGGSQGDFGKDIIQTNDGGFAVVGFSRSGDNDPTTTDGDVSQNNGFYDYWILKLTSTGEIEWENNFGYAGSDNGQALIQTKDGGYLLTGYFDVTASNGQGNVDGRAVGTRTTLHGIGEYWAIKIDAAGEREWSRYYGGTNNDQSYDVIEKEDGSFLLVGHTESNDVDITQTNGSYEVWIINISAQGDLVWEKTYGGSDADFARSAAYNNNIIYVAGDTRSPDGDVALLRGENADAWLLALDTNGNLIWEKTYGGMNYDSATAITYANEALYFCGSSRSETLASPNKGQNDLWIAQLDLSGNLLWETTLGGSNFDLAFDLVMSNDNSLLVVGSTESTDGDILINKGNKDILIAKYK